jgi:hypothetical protein
MQEPTTVTVPSLESGLERLLSQTQRSQELARRIGLIGDYLGRPEPESPSEDQEPPQGVVERLHTLTVTLSEITGVLENHALRIEDAIGMSK